MKIDILVFISISVILVSCTKNEVNNQSFNATIQEKGLDCGNSFLVKFEDGVEGLPENSLGNTFYEINLASEYKVKGKKVFLKFRKPLNTELKSCTDLGISYPQIYIIAAE